MSEAVMGKASFLNHEGPIITSMVQEVTPMGVKHLMDLSVQDGAEAFGMQFCKIREEYRNENVYRELFEYANGKPVYITNYRHFTNENKTDEQIGEELVGFAKCGATLCDVMGDIYDKQPGEFTSDPKAVEKQKELIKRIHGAGAEVLMSSHIMKFTPAERVLEIALGQQSRGADISKIVVGAENMSEQIENMKIIDLLKKNLKIPFLFLSGGESKIIRRIGGELGCCMYLCVARQDEYSTAAQPLLRDVRLIRDMLRK